MRELEGGAIANPDEKRMAGHYWLRKAELAPRPQLQAAIEQSQAAISAFAADVLSGKVLHGAAGGGGGAGLECLNAWWV